MDKQKLQFFRIDDLTDKTSSLASSSIKFTQLYEQIKLKKSSPNFIIYYEWKELKVERDGSLTLKKIVEEDQNKNPVFYVYDTIENGNACKHRQKYGQSVAEHQKTDQEQKEYWIGSNGHVLFDSRNTALLASSIKHASKREEFSSIHERITKNFNSSIIEPEEVAPVEEKAGVFRRIFMKLGLIKRKPTAQNLMNTIQAIKAIDNEQKLKAHISNEYSDYDPNFAAYLQAVYIRFGILNSYRLHYIDYESLGQFIIPYKIPVNAKVGIIGDYGTGLPDSAALLYDLIIEKEADIILHLGDVYYAGTPREYEEHVGNVLKEMRELAKKKISKDKEVLFYSIPGNHDYYSWGLPFLSFIININEGKMTKQEASYFCLRSEGDRWQFLGLDTAFHDSNPTNQINGLSLGPHLRHKEVKWFEDKMEGFPGSTILLTHHQLFSIHDRICGSLSKYRSFSCVNPLLSAQLFKYTPHISAWYWGHEHAFMMFADDVLGVRKCRLLGNSSFHVFEKEGPYARQKNFPLIPLIEQDQEYLEKYRPIDPTKKKQNLYNLCYALIDFGKEKKMDSCGIFASSLPVQYYCTPCYPSSQALKPHFKPYLLYEQYINPRLNSINVVDPSINNNFVDVNTLGDLQLKAEIGLFVDDDGSLNLKGCKMKVEIVQSKWSEGQIDPKLKDVIIDGSMIAFKCGDNDNKQSILFGEIWRIQKLRVMKDQFISIRTGDSFTLQNTKNGEYLGCIIQKTAFLKTFIHVDTQDACLFQFVKDSKVREKGIICE